MLKEELTGLVTDEEREAREKGKSKITPAGESVQTQVHPLPNQYRAT